MKEVAPDIFMITEKENSRFVKFSVNIFVIAGNDGLVFDAGYGKKKTSNYLAGQITEIETIMRKNGRDCNITRVLPSHGHWDHFSGIAKLTKKLPIKVLATKRMLNSMGSKKQYRDSFRCETEVIDVPTSFFKKIVYKISRKAMDEFGFKTFGIDFVSEPVELIEENSTLTIDNKAWEVIHLPGHCDDAIVLYNKETGILLGGDNILRTITTWLGPPRSDLEAYIKSLEYLLTLPNLKLILPAHGSPVTEPHKRIKEAINHRIKRTDEILNLIKDSGNNGMDFKKIYKYFYPSTKFHEKFIARGWILLTLQYLIEKKLISGHIEGKNKIFKITNESNHYLKP